MKKLKLLGIALALLLMVSAMLLWLSYLGADDSITWKGASSLEDWGRLAYHVKNPFAAGFLLAAVFGAAFLLANYTGKVLGFALGIAAVIFIGWKQIKAIGFCLGLATGLCVIFVASRFSEVYKLPGLFPWLLLVGIIGWRFWRNTPKFAFGKSEPIHQFQSWCAVGHLTGMASMAIWWISHP